MMVFKISSSKSLCSRVILESSPSFGTVGEELDPDPSGSTSDIFLEYCK